MAHRVLHLSSSKRVLVFPCLLKPCDIKEVIDQRQFELFHVIRDGLNALFVCFASWMPTPGPSFRAFSIYKTLH